jgi:hypothetical protein
MQTRSQHNINRTPNDGYYRSLNALCARLGVVNDYTDGRGNCLAMSFINSHKHATVEHIAHLPTNVHDLRQELASTRPKMAADGAWFESDDISALAMHYNISIIIIHDIGGIRHYGSDGNQGMISPSQAPHEVIQQIYPRVVIGLISNRHFCSTRPSSVGAVALQMDNGVIEVIDLTSE